MSLFGVASVDDIDSAIFTASLPKIDNQYISAAGRFAKTILKFAPQQFADIQAKDFLKLKLPPVLIFDDLERTNLKPKEILGAINGFVEQDKKHVILLANEEKLFDDDTSGEKEKVIGQTLTVVADIEAALDPMLEKLGDDARAFLQIHRAVVISVFNTAGCNNLRSLAQVLWDFGRLYNALAPALQEKTEGMLELLKVFVALGLEVKKGALGRNDLLLRQDISTMDPKYTEIPSLQIGGPETKIGPPLPIQHICQKYKDIEIDDFYDSSSFPTKIAVSILIDGLIDANHVNIHLAQLPQFVDPVENEPEWETIWRALRREPKKVELAFEQMIAKLQKLEYTIPGVILHVFSVWLHTPEMGLTKDSVEDIERKCRAYIDEIAVKGLLPKGNGSYGGYGFDRDSFEGLGYPNMNDPRSKSFQNMYDHMRATQDQLFVGSYSEICTELLEMMKTDPQKFKLLLCGESSVENKYHRTPILVDMSVERFIAKMLAIPSKNQVIVCRTLKRRYQVAWPELTVEQDWLKQIVEALQLEADKTTGVIGWQLRSNLKFFLRPHLITETGEDQL